MYDARNFEPLERVLYRTLSKQAGLLEEILGAGEGALDDMERAAYRAELNHVRSDIRDLIDTVEKRRRGERRQ